MSVTRHNVEGFDNAKNLLTDLISKDEPVFVEFSGALDSDGKSWCPDCVKAEPVIEDFLKGSSFQKNFHFVQVGIERSLWKDMTNPYRTDSKFKLKSVPTLMKWGGPQKLQEDECTQKSYLELLFEECL